MEITVYNNRIDRYEAGDIIHINNNGYYILSKVNSANILHLVGIEDGVAWNFTPMIAEYIPRIGKLAVSNIQLEENINGDFDDEYKEEWKFVGRLEVRNV